MRSGAPGGDVPGPEREREAGARPGPLGVAERRVVGEAEAVERADALVPRQAQVVVAVARDRPAEQAREHGALAGQRAARRPGRCSWRAAPTSSPSLSSSRHEARAARGVGLRARRRRAGRDARRARSRSSGSRARRSLAAKRVCDQLGSLPRRRCSGARARPVGLDARGVASRRRASAPLRRAAGAEQPAPAPAPGRVDVVRQRDREARAARDTRARARRRPRSPPRAARARGRRAAPRPAASAEAEAGKRPCSSTAPPSSSVARQQSPPRPRGPRPGSSGSAGAPSAIARPAAAQSSPSEPAHLRMRGRRGATRRRVARAHPTLAGCVRPRRWPTARASPPPVPWRPPACCPYLGDRVMHRDEALAVMVARRPLGELLETVQLVRGGAPLHFLLAKLVAELGGGLVATRAISAVGLLLAIVAVGLLGRALAGPVVGAGGRLDRRALARRALLRRLRAHVLAVPGVQRARAVVPRARARHRRAALLGGRGGPARASTPTRTPTAWWSA